MHSLRLPDETDGEFRLRSERVARFAKVLVDACLSNHCMQDYIDNPELPMITIESVRPSPTVRIEFEQAIAFGGIGETLQATKSKHWGDGPYVLPLEADDWFYPDRITYQYRANSLYNRRYEQRMRLKELLGKQYRPLVTEAKYHTKTLFLENLTNQQARAIQQILKVEPGIFWRACKGRAFLELPPRWIQRELPFADSNVIE